MTPPSRLAVSTPNPSRTISSSPWQSATRGENGRRSRRHANLRPELKKSFIYKKIQLGAEPNEPHKPQPPALRTHPTQIPNEAINSLKTNNPIGFVLSFPYPDRRALSHQPPDLVQLGAEPNEPHKPQPPALRTHPTQIPNEAINSLKTNNPIGFVLSFPYPDRRALSHQPPDLVHLLVRHRDTDR